MMTLSDIQEAAERIEGKVIRTPLVFAPTFSKMSGSRVFLKLENLQETGSFKLRGATSKILARREEIGPGGVVAASAGNHAQGVALAARRAGLPSTIVMPEWASITKQEATRSYGGRVILEGQSIGESIQRAKDLAREEGMVFIHPFDDEDIIAGQGTIGLEILEDLPNPDVVIVPIGGGGLMGGIALGIKALKPRVRIIGAQAAACPSAHTSRQRGRVTLVEAEKSIADGITVKQIGDKTFPILRDLVDEVVLVEEDSITAAILMLLERKKVLAEGAGAVPLAALLSGTVPVEEGSRVVLVISGGNMDGTLLDRVIRQGFFRNGRIMRFSVVLDDMPGALAGLLSVIARQKANVLHIYHDRSGRDLPITMTRVELELETRSHEHIDEVRGTLNEAGYHPQLRPYD